MGGTCSSCTDTRDVPTSSSLSVAHHQQEGRFQESIIQLRPTADVPNSHQKATTASSATSSPICSADSATSQLASRKNRHNHPEAEQRSSSSSDGHQQKNSSNHIRREDQVDDPPQNSTNSAALSVGNDNNNNVSDGTTNPQQQQHSNIKEENMNLCFSESDADNIDNSSPSINIQCASTPSASSSHHLSQIVLGAKNTSLSRKQQQNPSSLTSHGSNDINNCSFKTGAAIVSPNTNHSQHHQTTRKDLASIPSSDSRPLASAVAGVDVPVTSGGARSMNSQPSTKKASLDSSFSNKNQRQQLPFKIISFLGTKARVYDR